jgi:protein-arginine kinase activator protein McsA
MECAKIKSLLSEYMDKAFDNDTVKEVKEHLLSCKDCSREYFNLNPLQRVSSMERYRPFKSSISQHCYPKSCIRLPDYIPGQEIQFPRIK